MFEFDRERDGGSVRTRRRAFLLTSASAVAGLIVWSPRKRRFVGYGNPEYHVAAACSGTISTLEVI